MIVSKLTTPEEYSKYSSWLSNQPNASLWQSLEWKKYQEALGREAKIYTLMDDDQIISSALVIIDRTSFGLSTWDIPRGPVGSDIDQLTERIIADAKRDRCVSIYLSPSTDLKAKSLKLKTSNRHEQPEATRLIDLTQGEDEILKQMKQKGRYNISVAQKHNVTVKESDDIDAFYGLVSQTGKRDAFGILPKKHYEKFLSDLSGSFLLIARHDEKPIAALLGVAWDKKATYYYGASSYDHRALMAPYLIQWEAMRLCKQKGCTEYDLFGIKPPSESDNHPWSGVSAFKEKFGGSVVTYSPEKMIVLRPILQRLIGLKRKFC